MPVRETAQSEQTIEVGVTGPAGANRMFITTGHIRPNFSVSGTTEGVIGSKEETFTVLLNPPLGGGQFRRAIATAAVRAIYIGHRTGGSDASWELREVEADFDDESARVELRITVKLAATKATINIETISFQVTSLARVE